jgi:small subunit ribosomal protein S1
MEELRRSGALIEATVIDANRGAIDAAEAVVAEPVRAFVARRLRLRVLEVDPRHEWLILSEKSATQKLRRERKAHGAASLAVGDVLDGSVASVTYYGAPERWPADARAGGRHGS